MMNLSRTELIDILQLCNTLQYAATHYIILQQTATHCNTVAQKLRVMNLNRTELIHILQLCQVVNIESDDPLCRLNHGQLCALIASSAVYMYSSRCFLCCVFLPFLCVCINTLCRLIHG